MNFYRFSPIKTEAEMLKAIAYIHFGCHQLCKMKMGKYLKVAGNIGVFCHYKDEYEYLTKVRKKLTDESDNWNQKYFRLYSPIIIPVNGDILPATYTYLYIRKPDEEHPQVGDLDFYMAPKEYADFKQSLQKGGYIEGVSIFDRPDLDLVMVSDPKIDAVAFIGGKTMAENQKSCF